jgi:cell fate regulator YaaT (PSP1 superfamily)
VKHLTAAKIEKEGKVLNSVVCDYPLRRNDLILVNSEDGLTTGVVLVDTKPVPPDQLPADLKNVVRKMNPKDLATQKENENLEKEAFAVCYEKVKERDLSMKLVDVECLFDRSKLIFYFTADNRVDFRELVKDLVPRFKMRIELRQIGARNESKMHGGLGVCGRKICCTNFLDNLDRVLVKMAKEQNMPLNPEKISGLCGRLMCCLAFECETYMEMKKGMPKVGKRIMTSQGPGKVLRQNILRGVVAVELEGGKEIEIDLKEIREHNPG